MKKIYSLLFTLIAAAPYVLAKTTGLSVPNIFPHMGSGGGNGIAISNQSRLIGYTYLKHNGTSLEPVDSTTYSYSFGRGGQMSKEDMDDNFVFFDDSYTYLYLPSSGTYRNQYHRSQIYNGAGKSQRYNCQRWNLNSNVWNDSARYVYSYNNDLTLLLKTSFDIYYGGIWGNGHVIYENSYDVKSNLVRVKTQTFRMAFGYDANDNVIYRIDSLYYMSSGTWKIERHDFTYNSNNALITYTIQDFSNGSWVNKLKYDYTYTGSNITTTIEQAWNNNTWETKGQHLMNYDGSNNIVSDTWQYWDVASSSFLNASRNVWTYNGYSQPLTYYSETYEPSTSQWSSATGDFFYRYYYQAFIPADIPHISLEDKMKLFPQPATTTLSVEFSDIQIKDGAVAVLDMQGRVIKHEQMDNRYQKRLDISNLVNGVYFLKVEGENIQVSRKFIVSK